MARRTGFAWVTTWILAWAAGPLLGAPPQADALPDGWHSMQSHVARRLETEDVSRWARQLSAKPWPDAPAEWMLRFSVLRRAGHAKTLSALIDAMAAAQHRPDRNDRRDTADTLIKAGWWEPAQQFCQRMPDTHPGYLPKMVELWEAAGRDPRWIDAWLAARNGEDRPNEKDLASQDPSRLRFWFAIRLRFHHRRGTEGPLIEGLARAVRDDPADLAAALRYLAAVREAGVDEYDPRWIGDVVRPKLAVHCYELGRDLASLRPAAAVVLLERSLALIYTDEDDRIMKQRSRQMAMTREQTRSFEQVLRDATRYDLMYACKRAGKIERAQALLEELTKRYPNGIPPAGLAQFAGQVQAESGARVIANRIRQAEPQRKDSHEYWRERAQYYAGRQERDQAVEAFEKALELARPAPREVENGQGDNFARSLVLGDYVRLLGWNEKGMRLLWRELEASDPTTAFTMGIIDTMLHIERDNTHYLDPGDDRLWAVLAARPQWGFPEHHLLLRLARNAYPDRHSGRADRRAELWSRGEKLCENADPSRAETLGWVMTRHGATKRGIPLLASALSRAGDAEAVSRVNFTLLEAHLDLGDWRAAEAIWPAARNWLTPDEVPPWLARIAVLAAKAGDHDDALRIWTKRVNYDLTDLDRLGDLAKAGMRDRLVDLYRRLATRDPESTAPSAALGRLKHEDH